MCCIAGVAQEVPVPGFILNIVDSHVCVCVFFQMFWTWLISCWVYWPPSIPLTTRKTEMISMELVQSRTRKFEWRWPEPPALRWSMRMSTSQIGSCLVKISSSDISNHECFKNQREITQKNVYKFHLNPFNFMIIFYHVCMIAGSTWLWWRKRQSCRPSAVRWRLLRGVWGAVGTRGRRQRQGDFEGNFKTLYLTC